MFLSLGSNLDPARNLRRAVREIDIALGIERISRVYEGDPVGAPGTPRYLNAAVSVRTSLELRVLKYAVLRPIEARLGRRRTADPNAPRTIDIDIAIADVETVDEPELRLRVPDPDVARHAHVVLPLRDLDPGFEHPALGASLGALADGMVGGSAVTARDDVDLADALLAADPVHP